MRTWCALVSLLAAACAHGPRAPHAAQVACERQGGAACHAAGWLALGAGEPDDRAAAAAFLLGCETACRRCCPDLGALYVAGRGVRRDDLRACELGLADACARAGRPAPAEAAAPTAPLPPAAARPRPTAKADPRRVDGALTYARYFLDSELHAPLEITRAALEADPPAPIEDVNAVRALVGARLRGPESCLPVIRRVRAADGSPGCGRAPGEEPPLEPETGWASFVLAPDGRAAGVRAVVQRDRGFGERMPDAERCVVEAISGWEFPLPRVGGRVWITLEGRGPVEERPDRRCIPVEGEPSFALAGFVRPRAKDRTCVADRVVQWMPAVRDLPPAVTVMFAIAADGRPRRLRMMTPNVPVPLAAAIGEAVHACEWIPGRDLAGEPAALWVIMPLRFKR